MHWCKQDRIVGGRKWRAWELCRSADYTFCVGVSIELLVRAHITYVSMNMSLETTIPDQT